MADTQIEIRFSGTATRRTETESGVVEFQEIQLNYTETYTDPLDFHMIAARKRDDNKAEKVLPSEYHIEQGLHDNWDVSLSANAVEITDFAETVSEKRDELSTIDVLTLWLQSFTSMRVRRALHDQLIDNGLDVNRVD